MKYIVFSRNYKKWIRLVKYKIVRETPTDYYLNEDKNTLGIKKVDEGRLYQVFVIDPKSIGY